MLTMFTRPQYDAYKKPTAIVCFDADDTMLDKHGNFIGDVNLWRAIFKTLIRNGIACYVFTQKPCFDDICETLARELIFPVLRELGIDGVLLPDKTDYPFQLHTPTAQEIPGYNYTTKRGLYKACRGSDILVSSAAEIKHQVPRMKKGTLHEVTSTVPNPRYLIQVCAMIMRGFLSKGFRFNCAINNNAVRKPALIKLLRDMFFYGTPTALFDNDTSYKADCEYFKIFFSSQAEKMEAFKSREKQVTTARDKNDADITLDILRETLMELGFSPRQTAKLIIPIISEHNKAMEARETTVTADAATSPPP